MSSTSRLQAFLAEPRNVIVAGIRKDGRPHLSPNWFFWDGDKFYISTTRDRVKYAMFRRDPRAELVVDDATGYRVDHRSPSEHPAHDPHAPGGPRARRGRLPAPQRG